MILLGFRLDAELKEELSNNFENDLNFADNIVDFMDCVKTKKYEAIVIEEQNLKDDNLMNLIAKVSEFQKKGVIIVLGETSNLKVVAGSIKAGAYDYILKPEENSTIVKSIEKAVKDYKIMAERIDKNRKTGDKLIGRSKEMMDLYKMIGKVAGNDVPVLVVGERGTGKTSVAKAIHQLSNVSEEGFLSINCNSFRGELIERKLFGYEIGAFQGANFNQKGILEQEEMKILHLGNVESLSLDMQSKILYLLEEQKFFRLGGQDSIQSKVRIIASTGEDLELRIQQGKFIEELYRKLRVVEIHIPPLRNRKNDIPFIADHYIMECNLELNTNIRGMSRPALKKIMRYDWPGNVNELKNAIKSAMTLCRGSSILLEDLPSSVLGEKVMAKTGRGELSLKEWIRQEIQYYKNENSQDYYGQIISKVEKELIHQILEMTNGKKVETAEILGITRNTLRTKMNNYGLE